MTFFLHECEECDGAGTITCDNCDGSGTCICCSCEADHDCGWCEGKGEVDCEDCKGTGKVVSPDPRSGEETVVICEVCKQAEATTLIDIPAKAVCPACEAEWAIERLSA